jgi:hypothetical protein
MSLRFETVIGWSRGELEEDDNNEDGGENLFDEEDWKREIRMSKKEWSCFCFNADFFFFFLVGMSCQHFLLL